MSREQSPTRAEIISMAREAGFIIDDENQMTHSLERFAALIAAAERDKWMDRIAILIRGEREACAKLCDDFARDMALVAQWGAETCAKAIRARVETT